MYKNIELLITFVLQFFILDIKPNMFNVVGSAAIALGVMIIMGFRLIEEKFNQAKDSEPSTFRKFIFYTF